MTQKLFMVLLGSTPPGRSIEQHDVFFGIAETINELVPAIKKYWPQGRVHIDSWREVCHVDGHKVAIKHREALNAIEPPAMRLFFINLGGYKPGDMEEYHYKIIVAAPDKGVAIRMAKQTAFYKHTGFKGATSHVDDKFGIDVDDMHEISELLSAYDKANYSIDILLADSVSEDELHIGYVKL